MSISIEALVSRMEWAAARGLSELALTIEGTRVTILRDAARGGSPTSPLAEAPVVAERPEAADAGMVTAPLAGQCHLGPEADGAPFVRPGDRVEDGQTLCMMEAMKVLTNVLATCAGTVEAVLVQDGVTVAAGTPLIRIRS